MRDKQTAQTGRHPIRVRATRGTLSRVLSKYSVHDACYIPSTHTTPRSRIAVFCVPLHRFCYRHTFIHTLFLLELCHVLSSWTTSRKYEPQAYHAIVHVTWMTNADHRPWRIWGSQRSTFLRRHFGICGSNLEVSPACSGKASDVLAQLPCAPLRPRPHTTCGCPELRASSTA